MISRLLFSLALASPLLAQDGQQLFTLYCSACHGMDGKGATGGTFPPLAGSPYVAGDPDRAVKIILNGLTGPVDVLGKTFNLEMPPQGAVLPDDQLAAILTYVRKSWGNQAGPVTADQVQAIRASVADRTTPWTASEILKLHPLPFEKTALKNLISQAYAGKWSSMPDFPKLKATNVEEEHDGILSLRNAPSKENFAIVWTGEFVAPANGQYVFTLDADDAAAVFIDDHKVVEVKGSGPMDGSRGKKGKLTLLQGTHPIRVEYLQIGSQQGLALAWSSNHIKKPQWLSEDTSKPKGKPHTPIPVQPTGDRPVVYRNFIAGTTPRSIGIGFPGGLNLAYSADNLAPELLWTGKFIDGSYKWDQRGTANNPPAGEKVVNPSKSRALPDSARFKGYSLDLSGNPTFAVKTGAGTLLDSWHAGTGVLIRKLVLTGNGPPIDILISDQPIESQISITAPGGSLDTAKGRSTLRLTPGKPVTLSYRWK